MSHKPDIQLGCLVKEGMQSNIMGQGLIKLRKFLISD